MFFACYFEPYRDYSVLKDAYVSASDFSTAVTSSFSNDFDDVTFPSSIKTSLSTFLTKLCNGIYREFKKDKIAYKDKDDFIYRLTNTLANNIGYYFQSHNIDFMIIKNTDENKYILTSKAEGSSNENGNNASAVVQSTAMTPTGVSATDTGDSIGISVTKSETGLTNAVTEDAYANKYTNYQGKTNGVRKNVIDRSNEVTRTANYLLAIDLLNKLPRTYLEKVLKDCSEHFIVVY